MWQLITEVVLREVKGFNSSINGPVNLLNGLGSLYSNCSRSLSQDISSIQLTVPTWMINENWKDFKDFGLKSENYFNVKIFSDSRPKSDRFLVNNESKGYLICSCIYYIASNPNLNTILFEIKSSLFDHFRISARDEKSQIVLSEFLWLYNIHIR